MKKYLNIILGIVITALVLSVSVLSNNNRNLKQEVSYLKNNEKAYIAEGDSLKNQSRVFKLTIDQLKYSQDSLTDVLNEARKDLKIKDKEIKNLGYLLSEAEKVDTVYTRDTIFRDKNFRLDTLVGDKWFNCNLKLEYPNMIVVNPKYKNETIIATSSRKETINPPKKCAICRWFQKKHTVVIVDVIENNPYAEIKKQRFIEIVK